MPETNGNVWTEVIALANNNINNNSNSNYQAQQQFQLLQPQQQAPQGRIHASESAHSAQNDLAGLVRGLHYEPNSLSKYVDTFLYVVL